MDCRAEAKGEGGAHGQPGLDALLAALRGEAGRGRIRCPECGWRPRATDVWSCRCGCVWNTFETGGRCPDCHFRWAVTQCLSCHAFSPHPAWYAPEGSEPGGSEPGAAPS